MARAKIVIDAAGQPYGVRIDCPGCGGHHVLPTTPGHGAQWSWNGNLERPTFSPSVLVRSGHYADGTPPDRCCLCANAREWQKPSFCGVCHSFVRDGRIEFLADCTHALAGQTVDLPPIEASGHGG